MKNFTTGSLAEQLERLARILEADPKKKKKLAAAVIAVSAFRRITSSGAPAVPSEVKSGDALYIQRTEQPGAGTISKDPAGRPFATALEKVKAGKTEDAKVTLWEKRWVTDGDPCEECDENASVDWIPSDEEFPSGHDEPLGHPNCKCTLDTREA